MNRRALVFLGGLLPALLLAGCGSGADADATSGPVVVTGVYPLQYVAERVAGGDAQVVNVVQPGQEPHDLELTVEQTVQVADADVAVVVRGFQPALDEAVAAEEPDHVVEVADVVSLEDGDPHFWLDPQRLAAAAQAVGDGLAAADPEGAAAYGDRADAVVADLERLDQRFEAGLADCERSTVVVTHDAFGYLERYDLRFEAITGLSPEAEPSPERLAALEDLVRDEGVTTVFAEQLASPELAATLADDVGVTTAVLDPLEGLTEETSEEDYLSLMADNLQALRAANGCR